MKKRIVATMLSLCMIATLFVGCNDTDTSTTPEPTAAPADASANVDENADEGTEISAEEQQALEEEARKEQAEAYITAFVEGNWVSLPMVKLTSYGGPSTEDSIIASVAWNEEAKSIYAIAEDGTISYLDGLNNAVFVYSNGEWISGEWDQESGEMQTYEELLADTRSTCEIDFLENIEYVGLDEYMGTECYLFHAEDTDVDEDENETTYVWLVYISTEDGLVHAIEETKNGDEQSLIVFNYEYMESIDELMSATE